VHKRHRKAKKEEERAGSFGETLLLSLPARDFRDDQNEWRERRGREEIDEEMEKSRSSGQMQTLYAHRGDMESSVRPTRATLYTLVGIVVQWLHKAGLSDQITDRESMGALLFVEDGPVRRAFLGSEAEAVVDAIEDAFPFAH